MRDEILGLLRKRREDLLGLACRLIEANSENPPGDERAVSSVIQKELSDLGLPEPEVWAERESRPNLVVRLRGPARGPTLLLGGHIDTKPVGDRQAWRTDPFVPVVENGHLYGLGATDMKSGVAAMIHAAAALNDVGLPRSGELVLALTADEEAGGDWGAKHLVEASAVSADFALLGEPAGVTTEWEWLPVITRGVACFRVKVHGTQTHSSIANMIPTVNATLKMARVALEMDAQLSDYITWTPDPRFPVGITIAPGVMASSGVFYGVLSGYAELASDVRTLPGMTQDQLRVDLERFLDDLRMADPDLQVELQFEPPPLGWKDALRVPDEHPFIDALVTAAGTVLGEAPPYGAFPAWTDAIWYQGLGGIPTISAFGPGTITRAHSPNESVRVETIFQAAEMYALAAHSYLDVE